jgi:large subunit ribosomal protein L35Ae
LGFERAMRNQNPNVSLIQVEGVQTTKDAQFYLGKRIAYVYRAQREVNGSKIRVIWGRIARTHGTNGVVKARFRKNLPPKVFGASVRIVSICIVFVCVLRVKLLIVLLCRCSILPTSKLFFLID